MLLPLMRPQFLETAMPLTLVVGAAGPETVMFDAHADGLVVPSEIGLSGEGQGAEGAGCALEGRRGSGVE